MYLACSSESYNDEIGTGRLTVEDWFQLCRNDLGLTAVELEDKHIGDPTQRRLEEVRGAAERHGLEIVNIALMNNFGVADDGHRASEQARTTQWMAVSTRLGTRYLRTFAGWPEGDRDARWPAMILALQSVAAEAERRGVRLVMENHNHGGFVRTAGDALRIFEAVPSRALGLLLDTGNYLDGLASIELTVGHAWHVHAKFTRVGADGRDARVEQHPVVALLRDRGYEGCISVEYEGEEPGRTAVPRALAYLRTLVT
jgi:sugar phosphate isomerase/epimerase